MSPKSSVGAWMKVYVDEFVGGTSHMTSAEVGAYWLLLLHGWDNGGLPASPRRLALIARMSLTEFEVVWKEALAEKFTAHPDDPERLVNRKQEEVRAAQEVLHRQRSEAGRSSATARKKRALERSSNERSNERANGEGEDSGLRSEDSGKRTKGSRVGAGAPAPRRRRDGKAELDSAVEEWERTHAPMRSDLLEALESYRQRRVKDRRTLWDRDQWLETLTAGGGDEACLIEAFKLATRSGWQSVHPKPESAGRRSAQARTAHNIAQMREGLSGPGGRA